MSVNDDKSEIEEEEETKIINDEKQCDVVPGLDESNLGTDGGREKTLSLQREEQEEESGSLEKNSDDVMNDVPTADDSLEIKADGEGLEDMEPVLESKTDELVMEGVEGKSDGLIDTFIEEKSVAEVEGSEEKVDINAVGVVESITENVAGSDDEKITEVNTYNVIDGMEMEWEGVGGQEEGVPFSIVNREVESNVEAKSEVEAISEVNSDDVVDGMEMAGDGVGSRYEGVLEAVVNREVESNVEANAEVEAINEVNSDDVVDGMGMAGEGVGGRYEGVSEAVVNQEVESNVEASAEVEAINEVNSDDAVDGMGMAGEGVGGRYEGVSEAVVNREVESNVEANAEVEAINKVNSDDVVDGMKMAGEGVGGRYEGVSEAGVNREVESNVEANAEDEAINEVSSDDVVDGMVIEGEMMDDGDMIDEVEGKNDKLLLETSIEGNEREDLVEGVGGEEKVGVVVNDLEVSNADDEGIHSSVVKPEGELAIEVKEDAVIGRGDGLLETEIEGNGTESVVEGKVSEEKVGFMLEDSVVDNADDEGIASSVVKPEVELISKVNADNVSDSEQEQVVKLNDDARDISGDEKDKLVKNQVDTEATLMSESKIVDGNTSAGENKELVVEEDVKMEMGAGAGMELVKNDSSEKIHLGGDEAETRTENHDTDDKVLDEAKKMETDETRSDVDEAGEETDDMPDVYIDEEDETVLSQKETGTQDTEMETETDVAESGGKAAGGKRKRGKLTLSKPATRSSTKKTVGEDVCFICFDGGELFLCDHRGCPKAYHPSCVNRDEAFFRAKGRWNCGWHMCSICEKTARYMCYTCTFSLCKSCTKDVCILLVKGNKGFCEPCMRTVNLVENDGQGNKDEQEQEQVDFDDKSSWEYLFKDYYVELKSKLSLSYDEIKKAKNPYKRTDISSGSKKHESSAKKVADDKGSDSEDSVDKVQTSRPKRRKLKKRSAGDKAMSSPGKSDWASKELLELVSHMRDGDTSVISQFDVQELLLDYIKSNKLRDPRRKSQIVCDARLKSLFGKPRVAHFEMLKLLESHFFARDEHNDDGQGSVVDTENSQLDIDENGDLAKSKKRKTRRKSGSLVRQSNVDEYAAIDMHNISLIYLKRKLMEDLLEDDESFQEKAVGTFVRIRISGSNQKQDMYRLVQVVGTVKAPEPYRVGKKTTDIMVEILNLDKTEVVSIDIISNQEFTEEECKRLRQSIKCGLLSRLTVGEILDKAIEIQVARVNDWLESETLRLSHLRDRASDLGRRKELRECVEKLQVLKTPEERRRRLDEIPKVHADPKMDPSYESNETDSENEDSRRDAFMRSKGFNRRGRGPISPVSESSQKESWSSTTKAQNSRNLSSNSFPTSSPHVSETVNENSWNLGDKVIQESVNAEKLNSSTNSDPANRFNLTASRSGSFSGVTPVTSQSPIESSIKINESEKTWHYRDPSGKEQGPFSLVQLRKWNNSGYFPEDLKIWRHTDKESHYILLSDALAGKFPKVWPSDDAILPTTSQSGKVSDRPHVDGTPRPARLSKWDVNDPTSLHSPTPMNNVVPAPTVVLPNLMTHSPATAPVLNSVGHPGIPYSPTPNSQQLNPVGPTHQASELQSVQMHTHTHPSVVQTSQAASNQNLQSESWAQSHGQGVVTSSIPIPSGTYSNTSPVAWPQWSAQGSQTNIQPPTTPNASWGMRPPENNTTMPTNSDAGWGPAPTVANAGWPSWNPSMQAPNSGNTTQGWVAPPAGGAPPVGNMNPGWRPQGQVWGPGPAQGQVWVPPNGNQGAPVQGPNPGNGWGPPSGNPGAPPPVQGSAPPNANQGWGPPPANQGPWIGEQNHNSGQFQGHGRDSGFNNGRPWNRRGGGMGGNMNRRDTPCPFLARRGACKKGAYCEFLH